MAGGQEVAKDSERLEAYGTVDELNATVGLARLHAEGEMADQLAAIQNDLFDLGSDLCVPGSGDTRPRITSAYTDRIEKWSDEGNAGLEPLESFVLPGGTRASAWLHLARTVCRRAERLVVELSASTEQQVNAEAVRYLNRLSDLLFVWARCSNDEGRADILWSPGQNA